MAYDEELEEIKRRKLAELQRVLEERRKQEERLRAEMEKRAILRRILTSEARERLARLRLVRPEFTAALEEQLIALAMSGRINTPITDEQLKEILAKLNERRRRTRIIFK